jgi:hypothetical protein
MTYCRASSVCAFVLLSTAAVVDAQVKCEVAIESPRLTNASTLPPLVDRRGDVRGSAAMLGDQHLWVFVKRQYAANYTTGVVAEVIDQHWAVQVEYGAEREGGRDYVIVATIVTRKQHEQLLILRDARLPIPPPSQQCAQDSRVVSRSRK